MGKLNDFEKEIQKVAVDSIASWKKVDLHNHTPQSTCYTYKETDAHDLIAKQIRETGLSAVMFTDHSKLPEISLVDNIAKKSGALVLRGIELNIFVDAWNKPEDKVGKEMFFHLIVGFDPKGAQSPEYWVTDLTRNFTMETRSSGGMEIQGIRGSVEEVCKHLSEANAIIIPAHLHSTGGAFRSRSIDEIYNDREFLYLAKNYFTALEVTSDSTAAFFDGKHSETDNLIKTCIQSSDSHQPSELGWRPSYLQLETVNFGEIRAALQLPFRTSRTIPQFPNSSVIGMHVKGNFLEDLWMPFSPHANVAIGVKGSGKTSALECLRFALGTEVPKSRQESVANHLSAILGPAGSVAVLIKRDDGARLIVERSTVDKNFRVTFEDDRVEIFKNPASLHFPIHILGWHEIEQAASDDGIRRIYLDTIAGKEKIEAFDKEAKRIGNEIRIKHDIAGSKYNQYREIYQQVAEMQELRKGLQELTDANLVNLKNQYQASTNHLQALQTTRDSINNAQADIISHVAKHIAGISSSTLSGESPIASQVAEAIPLIDTIESEVKLGAEGIQSHMVKVVGLLDTLIVKVQEKYGEFSAKYSEEVSKLSPEQKRLLESHRKLMDDTKELATLEVRKAELKSEVESVLNELVLLCDRVAKTLDEKSSLRESRVSKFNALLSPYDVRLTVIRQRNSSDFEELSRKYANGANILNELKSKLPDRLAHLCLKKAYSNMIADLWSGYSVSVFDYGDFTHFLNVFEEDDLQIELRVGKAGQEYSPINELSAGQRCTGVFPVLLKLSEGPLIIDQPEDNLDNRHIANVIAQALIDDKKRRQMVFTSHNANLVVMSDPESIVYFDSDGTKGWIECQGFLATKDSRITKHVLDILDGGENALKLRIQKYGRA